MYFLGVLSSVVSTNAVHLLCVEQVINLCFITHCLKVTHQFCEV